MAEQDIYIDDIQPLSSVLSFIKETGEEEEGVSPIMSGQFRFDTFQNGLTTHATDAVEDQDANISAELPVGISFNFLFSGVIDYSFGSNKYCLRKNEDQTVQGSIIVNNSDEIFTRHLTAGMRIRKLNIFVEKRWLVSRCQTEAEQQAIAELFQQSNVYLWQPEEEAVAKAKVLIALNNDKSFSQKLTSEHLTMELLAICLDEVYRQVKNEQSKNDIAIDNSNLSFKAKLDNCMVNHHALSDIAQALNISVSTLQRQFKRNYNMNVSTYIKQRRLDTARKALLLGELSIGEVAFHAGYKYTSNFINAFKKSYSMTPAAYVKLHKIR